MTLPTRNIAAAALAGVWINLSEFLRNELLLKAYWLDHYRSLGLSFPSEPVNGAVWGVWGMLFGALIFWISRRFDLRQTIAIGWLGGFVLMWLTLGNLHVLPAGLLLFALPLSLLEVSVAALICRKLAPPR